MNIVLTWACWNKTLVSKSTEFKCTMNVIASFLSSVISLPLNRNIYTCMLHILLFISSMQCWPISMKFWNITNFMWFCVMQSHRLLSLEEQKTLYIFSFQTFGSIRLLHGWHGKSHSCIWWAVQLAALAQIPTAQLSTAPHASVALKQEMAQHVIIRLFQDLPSHAPHCVSL